MAKQRLFTEKKTNPNKANFQDRFDDLLVAVKLYTLDAEAVGRDSKMSALMALVVVYSRPEALELPNSPLRTKNGLPSTISCVAEPCLRRCGIAL